MKVTVEFENLTPFTILAHVPETECAICGCEDGTLVTCTEDFLFMDFADQFLSDRLNKVEILALAKDFTQPVNMVIEDMPAGPLHHMVAGYDPDLMLWAYKPGTARYSGTALTLEQIKERIRELWVGQVVEGAGCNK